MKGSGGSHGHLQQVFLTGFCELDVIVFVHNCEGERNQQLSQGLGSLFDNNVKEGRQFVVVLQLLSEGKSLLFLHSLEVVFELDIWLLMGNSKEFHDFLEGLFEDGLVLLHEVLFEADLIAAGDILGGFLIEKVVVHLNLGLWKGRLHHRLIEIWTCVVGVVQILA